jgi:hypothetical protein
MLQHLKFVTITFLCFIQARSEKKQLNSFDVFRVSFVGIFCKEIKEQTFPENKFETAKL